MPCGGSCAFLGACCFAVDLPVVVALFEEEEEEEGLILDGLDVDGLISPFGVPVSRTLKTLSHFCKGGQENTKMGIPKIG